MRYLNRTSVSLLLSESVVKLNVISDGNNCRLPISDDLVYLMAFDFIGPDRLDVGSQSYWIKVKRRLMEKPKWEFIMAFGLIGLLSHRLLTLLVDLGGYR